MREFSIVNIVPSAVAGVPAYIEVPGNLTQVFHGNEWIDGLGNRSPFFTYSSSTPPPYGTTVLIATTFAIRGNQKYDGRYTVYTRAAPGNPLASEFVGGNTRIRLAQAIPTDGVGTELTTGTVTNISTYVVPVFNESGTLVLERQYVQNRPIGFVGKDLSGWGEVFTNNLVKLAQNFAGPTAPTSPFYGQLWVNSATGGFQYWNGTNWVPMLTSVTHTQATSSSTWTVNHNLGERLVRVDVFVNTGSASPNDIKPATPVDITYSNTNTVVISLAAPATGIAKITR